MRKIRNEVKVGIFFFACLAGLIYLTISTGKLHLRDEGYNIYVVFDDISGLQENSPVMVNGLEVGRVKELSIANQADGSTKVMLKLLINKDTKICNNPVVSIKTLGLMGEKFVHIKNLKGESFLEPDSVLVGQKPTDMDTLLEEANKLSENLNDTVGDNKESLDNIVKNFESASKNFDEFSADLKRHPWKLLYRPKDDK